MSRKQRRDAFIRKAKRDGLVLFPIGDDLIHAFTPEQFSKLQDEVRKEQYVKAYEDSKIEPALPQRPAGQE